MFAPAPNATVSEVWHLALPTGTALVAGEVGLTQQVDWVATLRATFPVFGELKQSYLALASMSLVRHLGPRITLPYLLQELSRVKAAALVLDEPIGVEEASLADVLGLPVLVLPEGSELHAIEREVLRALVDREGQLARRQAEVRQSLQRMYGANGLEAVLSELARQSEGQVTLADVAGVQVSAAGERLAPPEAVEHAYPVTVAGRGLGELTVRTATYHDGLMSDVYAREAAEICGIEMLQQLTRRETEERLGAELVEQLLDASHDLQAVATRMVHLGYDLAAQRHHLVVAYVKEEGGERAYCEDAARDLRWVAERDGASVLVVRYREAVLAYCSFAVDLPDRRARAWVRESLANLSHRVCHAGVSRLQEGIAGLREATSQALDAVNLGQRIVQRLSPYYYEELGLYRLLVRLSSRDELQRFYHETLGLLAQYDAEHNTELVKTLEAFFEYNANASQTARALYVHRNTLNYRLQRIVEITGLDLNDAEARLAFQLALKIRHISS
jgi:purine catabolism regulator